MGLVSALKCTKPNIRFLRKCKGLPHPTPRWIKRVADWWPVKISLASISMTCFTFMCNYFIGYYPPYTRVVRDIITVSAVSSWICIFVGGAALGLTGIWSSIFTIPLSFPIVGGILRLCHSMVLSNISNAINFDGLALTKRDSIGNYYGLSELDMLISVYGRIHTKVYNNQRDIFGRVGSEESRVHQIMLHGSPFGDVGDEWITYLRDLEPTDDCIRLVIFDLDKDWYLGANVNKEVREQIFLLQWFHAMHNRVVKVHNPL